jgi:Tfp pilus assembly protein PilN
MLDIQFVREIAQKSLRHTPSRASHIQVKVYSKIVQVLEIPMLFYLQRLQFKPWPVQEIQLVRDILQESIQQALNYIRVKVRIESNSIESHHF